MSFPHRKPAGDNDDGYSHSESDSRFGAAAAEEPSSAWGLLPSEPPATSAILCDRDKKGLLALLLGTGDVRRAVGAGGSGTTEEGPLRAIPEGAVPQRRRAAGEGTGNGEVTVAGVGFPPRRVGPVGGLARRRRGAGRALSAPSESSEFSRTRRPCKGEVGWSLKAPFFD